LGLFYYYEHKLVPDHKNGDKLNNKDRNIKIVTHRENTSLCFRKDRNTLTSKFPGVCLSKSKLKWQAGIKINGKQKHLSLFNSEIEAYKAYQIELNKIKSL